MTTVFDLRAILTSAIETAIDLAQQGDEVTVDQVMEKVMTTVNIQQIELDLVKPKKARASKPKEQIDPDFIDRIKLAPSKPRTIPDDDTRCCARSFYEHDHLDENKQIKVMRDDEANLYGDRCKKTKTDGDFCNTHNKGQPLGVWGNGYDGKLKKRIDKLNAPAQEPKPKADKAEKVAKPKADKAEKVAKPKTDKAEKVAKPKTDKAEKVAKPKAEKPKAKPKVAECEIETDEEEKEIEEEDEETETETKTDPKPIAPAEDEEAVGVEECEIEGKAYLRDDKGNIYDAETEEHLGIYNFKAKKWVKLF
jgi:hypothetical protein